MIYIGKVYKVYYLIFLKNKKKKKKGCFFIGICINKKNKFFELTNKVSKEQIIIKIEINSPCILKIINLSVYKQINFRLFRIYFIKRINYFDDLNLKGNNLDSGFNAFKYNYFYSAFFKKRFPRKKKKLKKLKRKYFKTLR